jgi:hypothetical protein
MKPVKEEEFLEVQDAMWPAARRSPPAAQLRQRQPTAQRSAAYLFLSPGGSAGDVAHRPGRSGQPRGSVRKSPFLHAAEQQMATEPSGPGEIPGQLVSPTKASAGQRARREGEIIEEVGGEGADALIQPKFGVYLPVDDFDEDNEMKHEASQPLSRCTSVCVCVSSCFHCSPLFSCCRDAHSLFLGLSLSRWLRELVHSAQSVLEILR